MGIVTQTGISPTLHICDVPWWCQPVHIPGAGGQLIVEEGGIGVKCVQVQEYQYHRTSWVAAEDPRDSDLIDNSRYMVQLYSTSLVF